MEDVPGSVFEKKENLTNQKRNGSDYTDKAVEPKTLIDLNPAG